MSGILCQEIFGTLLIISGVWDGWKYRLQTNKVRKNCSSKNCSRMFCNLAILGDLFRLAYGISKVDWFLISTSIIALYFMVEYWWAIYMYYDYKTYPRRQVRILSRPMLFTYIKNSFIPNKRRTQL